MPPITAPWKIIHLNCDARQSKPPKTLNDFFPVSASFEEPRNPGFISAASREAMRMFSPIFPIYPKLDSTRIGLQVRSGRSVEGSPESTTITGAVESNSAIASWPLGDRSVPSLALVTDCIGSKATNLVKRPV